MTEEEIEEILIELNRYKRRLIKASELVKIPYSPFITDYELGLEDCISKVKELLEKYYVENNHD